MEISTKFKKIPFNQRIIFLPHCLRSLECKAPFTQEGIQCQKCGQCKIGFIIEEAEKLGYKKVLVASGGSVISSLVKKYKPKGVIGVACKKELELGLKLMKKFKIPAKGLQLEKDGCVNTDVDLKKLKQILKS